MFLERKRGSEASSLRAGRSGSEEIGLISPHLDEFNPPKRGLWLASAIFAHNICRVQNPEFASLAARSLPPSSLSIPSIQPFDPTVAARPPSLSQAGLHRSGRAHLLRPPFPPPSGFLLATQIRPDSRSRAATWHSLTLHCPEASRFSAQPSESGCRAAGRVGPSN